MNKIKLRILINVASLIGWIIAGIVLNEDVYTKLSISRWVIFLAFVIATVLSSVLILLQSIIAYYNWRLKNE